MMTMKKKRQRLPPVTAGTRLPLPAKLQNPLSTDRISWNRAQKQDVEERLVLCVKRPFPSRACVSTLVLKWRTGDLTKYSVGITQFGR